MAVTKRQKQVLDFVAHFVGENGYSPSYEEIKEGLSLKSLATIHKHITTLESKQYLKRGFNQSRSLDLGPMYLKDQQGRAGSPSLEIPLAGRIAAGSPVEAIEQRETVGFGDFVGNPDVYALEVRGDSMIEDHICSGDVALIERCSSVRDGEIVVALIEGSEATLKRFYREPGGMARLQPANSTLKPIFVPMKDLEIQGKLLAVLRKYK